MQFWILLHSGGALLIAAAMLATGSKASQDFHVILYFYTESISL